MLYVDDSLILCEAKGRSTKDDQNVLTIFEGIFGMHINWRKSLLFSVNLVLDMESLAQILGAKVGNLSTIYLGMLMGEKIKSLEIWNGVLERCEKKLTKWRSQYLSLGGRLTLNNSVLDALPIYMMSL